MTLRGTLFVLPLAILFTFGFAGPLAGHAQALEKKARGDTFVPEGVVEEEVRTGWGDIVVHGGVRGDVSSGWGEIRVHGPVGGDVEAGSGDVLIDDRVGGDVRLGAGSLYLGPQARVSGNVIVSSGRFDEHSDAKYGELWAADMSPEGDDDPPGVVAGLLGRAAVAALFAAAAVLLAVVAPRPLKSSAAHLEAAPGRALLVGLGSVPAVVVACVALAITGVGLLVIPFLLPAYLALVLFGAPVAAYALGRRLLLATGRYRAGDAVAAAVGALLVVAASLIPYLGGPIVVFLLLAGTGAVLLALIGGRDRLRRYRRGAILAASPARGHDVSHRR